ncbi:hypothetical protein V8E51_013405 [Hyaloscypha variabilis]
MPTFTFSLTAAAPGGRRYASAVLRDSSRNSVYRSRPSPPTSPSPRPSSPFYLCTDPSSPATFEPFLDRGLGEVVRQGDISQWTEIKDPFARERGNTHTSDIDSVDFSVSSSGLTLYSGSPSEYNESDFEGSHSSDLVPVLSPCVLRPPPVSFRSRRPRGRFYNPRYDPGHPLFEPHLLLPRSAAASLSPSLDQDDNSLLELDPSSPLGTNLYSTFPVPGEWPDFDSSPEPASGPVGWLKALTSPAVRKPFFIASGPSRTGAKKENGRAQADFIFRALLGVAVTAGLCAAHFLPWALNNALPSRGVGRQYLSESLGKPTEQSTHHRCR